MSCGFLPIWFRLLLLPQRPGQYFILTVREIKKVLILFFLILELPQYSNKGATVCINCTLGYYAPSEGQPACTVCPGGYIANGEGLSTVEICPSGTFAGARSSECTNCHLGYYSSAGSTTCADACPAGLVHVFLFSTICAYIT